MQGVRARAAAGWSDAASGTDGTAEAVRVAVLMPHNFSDPWGIRSLATNGRAVAALGDDGFVRVWVVSVPTEDEGDEDEGTGYEDIMYDI